MRPSSYRPELDVLRFAAFGLIFLHHALPRGGTVGIAADACAFGLPLFFMLSAFLICGNLSREKEGTGSVDVPAFYRRRCLRIWPLYVFAVALSLGFDQLSGNTSPRLGFVASLLTFTTDLYYSVGVHRFADSPASPLWSISVEEQFYLVFPFVVAALGRRGQWIACAVTMATSVAIQFGMGAAHAERSATIWTSPLVHAEFIAAGSMLALWVRDRSLDLGAGTRLAFGLFAPVLWITATMATACNQPGAAPSGVSVVLGYQLATVGCLLALLCLYDARARMPKLLVWLGSISYGLYVFHPYGVLLAGWVLDAETARHVLVAFGITIVLAATSYRYLEAPFLRLKASPTPPPSPGAPVAMPLAASL